MLGELNGPRSWSRRVPTFVDNEVLFRVALEFEAYALRALSAETRLRQAEVENKRLTIELEIAMLEVAAMRVNWEAGNQTPAPSVDLG